MEDSAREKIKASLEKNRVCLFMKGNRKHPECGFSAQVVQVLDVYGVNYETVDVLQDWSVREGIKEYANWPTIPQLYVDEEFVGGCDIVTDMHRQGTLKETLDPSK